ncbi:cystathionine beta-lyase [Lampropedia cohaerens]|uniref:Cystathionine beta-lyase n=1 Tax=Lampropedia cohaerens TaxID=1610491 RepID=A0A0U1PZZ6_9BURK|nr:cystathionine beta-lyase [Lampropedia cohaerens]
MSGDGLAANTRLLHHPYTPPPGFAGTTVPMHKASTIFFPNMAAVRNRDWAFKSTYTYGLAGTPTSYVLEERLATLDGARYCLLAPSGLAAITLVNLALLKGGDHVLLPDNVYQPSRDFVRHALRDFGVTCDTYDPLNAEDLAARITPQTKLVWLEAAGSVTMEFPDLAGLLQVCNARGVRTALDNTWGASLAFRPFALHTPDGAPLKLDVCIHALTKYPSGGGDVLMGSITTCDAELLKAIKLRHLQLGLSVGMNDVEAILRSLPNMALRYAAQDQAARNLAQFVATQEAVTQVLHPALPNAPGHAHWQAVCGAANDDAGAAAGIFSFVAADWNAQQVDAFCESLQLFRIGYSWGGPISLVMAYDMEGSPARHRLASRHVIRLCIGLEDVADLQADLAQAFAQVARHTP